MQSSSELDHASMTIPKTSLLQLVYSYLDEIGEVEAANELLRESCSTTLSSSSTFFTSLRSTVCTAIAMRNIPRAQTELASFERLKMNAKLNFYLSSQHAINLIIQKKKQSAFEALSFISTTSSSLLLSPEQQEHFDDCCGLLLVNDLEGKEEESNYLLSQEKCNELAAMTSRIILEEEENEEANKNEEAKNNEEAKKNEDRDEGSTETFSQLETMLKEVVLNRLSEKYQSVDGDGDNLRKVNHNHFFLLDTAVKQNRQNMKQSRS
jgi:hypothetical protein